MEQITVNGVTYCAKTGKHFYSKDYFNINHIMKRFLKNVKKTNRCWIWKKAPNNGYGRFGVNNHRIFAHRFSYMMYVGHIDSKMIIHHECGNKMCVNPKHLKQVTPKQNTNIFYNGNNLETDFKI